MRRAALAALAAMALVVAGCPGVLRPLEKPRVRVAAVSFGELSLAGIELLVELEVTNPNHVALPLRAVDWQLAVGGGALARGRLDLAAEVPARGSAPVRTAVRIGPGAAIGVARVVRSGDARWRLDGVLHFETSLGELAAAFSHEGGATSGAGPEASP